MTHIKKLVYSLLLILTSNCLRGAMGPATIHKAVKAKNAEAILHFIKQDPTCVNQLNRHGQGPLHRAVYTDSPEIAQLLIDNGANIDLQDILGETPLIFAILLRETRMVRFLLEQNANVNLPDKQKETPLWHAVLGYPAQDPVKKGEIITLLINHNARINEKVNGMSLLHMATSNYDIHSVRLLLLPGTDIEQKDSDGKTPIDLCDYCDNHIRNDGLIRKNNEIARLLLGHWATIHLQGVRTYNNKPLSTQMIWDIWRLWPQAQKQTSAAKLAFCGVIHPRLNANSPAKILSPFVVQEILTYVHPINCADTQIANILSGTMQDHTHRNPNDRPMHNQGLLTKLQLSLSQLFSWHT